MKISTIGIDLAKAVFQVHEVDAQGKAVVKKQSGASSKRYFSHIWIHV